MFRPTIQNPLSVGGEPSQNVINAPCTVSHTIAASPLWFQNNPGDNAARAAEVIVNYYAPSIWQMLAAARQSRELAGHTGDRVTHRWPGLMAELTFNFGQEALRLVVTPENVRVDRPSGIQTGQKIDVIQDFVAFPYPGSTQSNGQPPRDSIKQYEGPLYVFDPGFSPSGPGPTTQVDSTGIKRSAAPELPPDLNYAGSDLPPLANDTYIKVFPRKDPDYTVPYGYREADWCKNVGGSGVLTTALTGLQYWEVEVVEIPRRRVPDTIFVPWSETMADLQAELTYESYGAPQDPKTGAWQGQLYSSITTDVGSAGTTYTWPTQLDTFFTPAIGVCPGYFLPDDLVSPASTTEPPSLFQDFGRVLGLDPLMDPSGPTTKLARSVYTMPVSTAKDMPTASTRVSGYWQYKYEGTVDPDGASVGTMLVPLWGGLLDQGTHFVTEEAVGYTMLIGPESTYYGPYSTRTPPGSDISWVAGTPSMAENTVYSSFDTATGQYVGESGPPDGLTPIYSAADWRGINWLSHGGDGDAWQEQYVNVISTWRLEHVVPARNTITPQATAYGDWVAQLSSSGYASFDAWIAASSDKWKTISQPGTYSPVVVGRWDALYNGSAGTSMSNNATATDDGSNVKIDGSQSFSGGKMGMVGSYTGVDLGVIEVGDVLMIAANSETGYVWFGRNGVWYGQDGPLDSSSEGPAFKTKWAAIMDGCTKSANPVASSGPWDAGTAPPQYFPCVSWHMGRLHLRFIIGGDFKYGPPSGFTAYGK
jgi:hypothetical protein